MRLLEKASIQTRAYCVFILRILQNSEMITVAYSQMTAAIIKTPPSLRGNSAKPLIVPFQKIFFNFVPP